MKNINERLRDMENIMRKSHIYLSGVPKGDNREVRMKKYLKIKMTRIFPGF